MLLSIQRDLLSSLAAMRNIMVTMMSRGQTLDQLETDGAFLEQSSELFVVRTLPWWKRCWRASRCFRRCTIGKRKRIIAVDRVMNLSENGYMEL